VRLYTTTRAEGFNTVEILKRRASKLRVGRHMSSLGDFTPDISVCPFEEVEMCFIDRLFSALVIDHPETALAAIRLDFIVVYFPVKHEVRITTRDKASCS
jgi:hypothetical protein